jgi:hypothetical protein
VLVEVWDSLWRISRLFCDWKSNCVVGVVDEYLVLVTRKGRNAEAWGTGLGSTVSWVGWRERLRILHTHS